MSKETSAPRKKKGISVLNWMGTLVLTSIPVVNIIVLIIMAATAKTRSKRTFAGAALIMMAITIALIIAAFVVFGDQLTAWANDFAAAK